MRLLWILPVLLLSACTTRLSDDQEFPQAFLEIGEGGGFTGFYTGYRLWRNGTLLRWQQQRTIRTVDTVAQKSAAEVAQWFQRADSLRRWQQRQVGNYSYWLIYATEQDTVRFQWQEPSQLPETVYRFYQELSAFLQAAVQERQ